MVQTCIKSCIRDRKNMWLGLVAKALGVRNCHLPVHTGRSSRQASIRMTGLRIRSAWALWHVTRSFLVTFACRDVQFSLMWSGSGACSRSTTLVLWMALKELLAGRAAVHGGGSAEGLFVRRTLLGGEDSQVFVQVLVKREEPPIAFEGGQPWNQGAMVQRVWCGCTEAQR